MCLLFARPRHAAQKVYFQFTILFRWNRSHFFLLALALSTRYDVFSRFRFLSEFTLFYFLFTIQIESRKSSLMHNNNKNKTITLQLLNSMIKWYVIHNLETSKQTNEQQKIMEYITKHMRCKEFPQNTQIHNVKKCANMRAKKKYSQCTHIEHECQRTIVFRLKMVCCCISTKCNCVCSIWIIFLLFLYIFNPLTAGLLRKLRILLRIAGQRVHRAKEFCNQK